MPASPVARLGDRTAHGGTIGPVTTGVGATVNIGGLPAACQGDPHVCLLSSGPKPHVGGTIVAGSLTVFIGGRPAARLGDATVMHAGAGSHRARRRHRTDRYVMIEPTTSRSDRRYLRRICMTHRNCFAVKSL